MVAGLISNKFTKKNHINQAHAEIRADMGRFTLYPLLGNISNFDKIREKSRKLVHRRCAGRIFPSPSYPPPIMYTAEFRGIEEIRPIRRLGRILPSRVYNAPPPSIRAATNLQINLEKPHRNQVRTEARVDMDVFMLYPHIEQLEFREIRENCPIAGESFIHTVR